MSSVETFRQEEELAAKLFTEFSVARNSLNNDFCTHWDNLNQWSKGAWRILASQILQGKSCVTIK